MTGRKRKLFQTCTLCAVEQPRSIVYFRVMESGNFLGECKDCMRRLAKARYALNKMRRLRLPLGPRSQALNSVHKRYLELFDAMLRDDTPEARDRLRGVRELMMAERGVQIEQRVPREGMGFLG